MNSKQQRKHKRMIFKQLHEVIAGVTSKDIADNLVEALTDLGKAHKEITEKDVYINKLERLIADASNTMHEDHQLLLVSFVAPKDHKFFQEVMTAADWE